MTHFETSSQKTFFLFNSHEVLTNYRKEAIEKFYKSYASDLPKDLPLLSVEEHHLLVLFYLKKLQQICLKLKFSPFVESSASHYFKRFFLKETAMEHDITGILLTCIFLATKIEEERIPLDEFLLKLEQLVGKKLQRSPILNTEAKVLQSFQFSLFIHHPYRAISAIINDFTTSMASNSDGINLKDIDWQKLYNFAIDFARETLFSDAGFFYPPGVIAMASFMMGLLSNSVLSSSSASAAADDNYDRLAKIFQEYLKRKLSSLPERNIREFDQVMENIKDIQALKTAAMNLLKLPMNTYKDLEKRLKDIRTVVAPIIENNEKCSFEAFQNEEREKKRKKIEKMQEEDRNSELKLLT